MGKYLHFFNSKNEHNEAYDYESDAYYAPWTGHVPRNGKGYGVKYFVTYDKPLQPSQKNVTIELSGGSITISAGSSYSWTATTDSAWITVSPSTGSSGETTLTITTTSTAIKRTGTIILTDSKNHRKEITVIQEEKKVPEFIWVDEFDDIDYLAEDSGFESVEDYMEAYLEDPNSWSSNLYQFCHNTLTFDGTDYYLYRLTNTQSSGFMNYALLPITYSYDYLYENSMEADYDNRFRAFSYYLRYDEREGYSNEDHSNVVVSVENPITPTIIANPPATTIWVDDFPDGIDEGYQNPYDPDFVEEFYGYSDFDDYLYDYIEDPSSFGSNEFTYTDCTIEYDGDLYYVYYTLDYGGYGLWGLLPVNTTFQNLYNNSIENDHTNRYEPFAYVLNSDSQVYAAGDENYVLVKVEE